MALGHEWVLEEFGAKPRIGWQIDPFGHSLTNARLFAEIGFDALFFSRIDYKDKYYREIKKELEWVWYPYKPERQRDWDWNSTQGQTSFGSEVNILAHTLYSGYGNPNIDVLDYIGKKEGFKPWNFNESSEEFDADHNAATFARHLLHKRCISYIHNECLVVIGGDFNFIDAKASYSHLEEIINFMNLNYGDKLNMFYSTPSNYIDALNHQNIRFPTKYDDLFPYADSFGHYWTGFYSSRPNLKKLIRKVSQ